MGLKDTRTERKGEGNSRNISAHFGVLSDHISVKHKGIHGQSPPRNCNTQAEILRVVSSKETNFAQKRRLGCNLCPLNGGDRL